MSLAPALSVSEATHACGVLVLLDVEGIAAETCKTIAL